MEEIKTELTEEELIEMYGEIPPMTDVEEAPIYEEGETDEQD